MALLFLLLNYECFLHILTQNYGGNVDGALCVSGDYSGLTDSMLRVMDDGEGILADNVTSVCFFHIVL